MGLRPMSDPPRYTLTIKIEADTPDAIYRALAEIETLILSDCRQRVGVRRDAIKVFESMGLPAAAAKSAAGAFGEEAA